MRFLTVTLGLLVSGFAFAGGDVSIPLAPKKDVPKKEDKVTKPDECPPAPTPSPKPKCKIKPKAKPKPKPIPPVVKCPDVKCKPCENKVTVIEKPVEKIVEKPVEKIQYVDRKVIVDTAPKNTLNLLAGVGPHGLVTDSYATEERKDEYAVRKEQDKAIGAVIGLQYQYRFTPTFNLNGLVISNQTIVVGGGYSW